VKNKAALFFTLISFLIFFFLLGLTSKVFARSQAYWNDHCQKISLLPDYNNMPDFTEPAFIEPTWDELDNLPNSTTINNAGDPVNVTYKTTVNDTFDLTDTANPDTGAYGGTLTISNLSLPHAKKTADYLEGRFLDEDHRMADFRTFDESQYLLYSGPMVKLMPQKTLDKLRAGYINALIDQGIRLGGPNDGKAKTPDINLTFSDVCGQNPRTIYDLAKQWGIPSSTPGFWTSFQIIQMPSAKQDPTPEDWKLWDETWGRYWPKIPVHDPGARLYKTLPEMNIVAPPNMRSRGCLVFIRNGPGQPAAPSDDTDCPEHSSPPGVQVVKTGVPDVLRLNTLGRFTQDLLLPNNMISLYFCKFLGLIGKCEEGEDIPPHLLGAIGPNTGEGGVGGSPIYLYDDQTNQKVESVRVNLTGSTTPDTPVTETVAVNSKFPYVGLAFGKLTAAITGAFKYFDPRKVLEDPYRYQENSSKVPAGVTFADTTDPSGGSVSEVRVWAGWLTGVKHTKDFVVDTLWPFNKK